MIVLLTARDRRLAWNAVRDQAACQNQAPHRSDHPDAPSWDHHDGQDPGTGGTTAQAKIAAMEICQTCPVFDACEMLGSEGRTGVWAGKYLFGGVEVSLPGRAKTGGTTAVQLDGQRFGHLRIKREAAASGPGRRKWLCVCDCGTTTDIPTQELREGRNTCGRQCPLRRLA